MTCAAGICKGMYRAITYRHVEHPVLTFGNHCLFFIFIFCTSTASIEPHEMLVSKLPDETPALSGILKAGPRLARAFHGDVFISSTVDGRHLSDRLRAAHAQL